jgi:hypothetical protein
MEGHAIFKLWARCWFQIICSLRQCHVALSLLPSLKIEPLVGNQKTLWIFPKIGKHVIYPFERDVLHVRKNNSKKNCARVAAASPKAGEGARLTTAAAWILVPPKWRRVTIPTKKGLWELAIDVSTLPGRVGSYLSWVMVKLQTYRGIKQSILHGCLYRIWN